MTTNDALLLQAILDSDNATPGNPELPAAGRAAAAEWLRMLLIDPNRLRRHIRALREHFHKNKASLAAWGHKEPLAEDTERLLVERGPSALADPGVLSDQELAALAINYVALLSLRDQIHERLPGAWWSDIRADALRFLQDAGTDLDAMVRSITGRE